MLGLLIYECVHGLPPFFHREKEILHQNILNSPLTFKPNLDTNLVDILKKLLERDPEKRLGFEYGADEVKAHPYFEGIDWD